MNYETLQANKTVLINKIQNKYKNNESQFYKELHTTNQTFWKRYDNQKIPISQIFQIQILLELTRKEILSIFFGETEGTRKALYFFNNMLEYIKFLSDKEKKDFIIKFSEKFERLKEEQC